MTSEAYDDISRLAAVEQLIDQAKFGAAEVICRDLLRREPKNLDARTFLGICLHGQGKHDAAIKEHSSVLGISPNSPNVWYFRGQCWLEKGELRKANADLLKAIELSPKLHIAYDSLATIASFAGDWELVGKYLNLAAEHGGPTASRLMTLASCKSFAGDRDGALAILNEAIELEPRNEQLRRERFDLAKFLERYDIALTDVNALVDIAGPQPALLLDRARTYWYSEQYSAALVDCQAVLARHQDRDMYLDALSDRAIIFFYLNQFHDSIADSTIRIKEGVGCEMDYRLRGEAYDALAMYPEAVADYTSALRLTDSHFVVRDYRARSCAKAGMSAMAIDDFTFVLGHPVSDSTKRRMLVGRASVYRELGRIQEAEQDERAAENFPAEE